MQWTKESVRVLRAESWMGQKVSRLVVSIFVHATLLPISTLTVRDYNAKIKKGFERRVAVGDYEPKRVRP